MSLTIATTLALIPEPIKMALIGGVGWIGKSSFDWMKSKRQEKRDDFKTVSDTLFAEMERLSKRVDKAEEETKECETRYIDLINKYNELLLKYANTIENNTKLQEEINALRLRIEQYDLKEKNFLTQ